MVTKVLFGFFAAFLVLFSTDSRAQQRYNSYKSILHFHNVTRDLYRGGRPKYNDLLKLQNEQRVVTIINLEDDENSIRREGEMASSMGIDYISSPMSWKIRPSDEQVNMILDTLGDSSRFPVFIHCYHGQDRTGLIIGLYRVEVQGWSPSEAYKEMLHLGFHSKYRALDRYFRERTGYY